MKKYITLFLFVIISAMSYGQGNYQDVVYLKNGSIIRGIIIEQVPNKSIKIETVDRNVFVFQMDEIEKLTKEPLSGKRSNILNSNVSETGKYSNVELGYQIKVGDYGIDRLKLNIISGYKFNPYFSLGVGTGLRYYFDTETALIPLYADFRTNFVNSAVTPYLSLVIGYSFDATNEFKGVGLLLNPALGVNFMVSDKTAMNIGFGYEMQKMKFYFYNTYSGYIFQLNENSGALSLNIGLTF